MSGIAPETPLPPPRWQRRPEARPEEILDAALEIFGDRGFARAKLDEIARHAGISKGTLYLYFDSKESIFRAMVRARVVTVVMAGEELLRSHQGSYRDLLVKLTAQIWRTVRDPKTARIIRLVHSELSNFPELTKFYFDEVILRARRVLEAAIIGGIDAGEFRPVDPQCTARAFPILLVHSAQFQCFFHSYDPAVLSDERFYTGILDLLLNGVLSFPPSPGDRSP